jgi:hypothetical protein
VIFRFIMPFVHQNALGETAAHVAAAAGEHQRRQCFGS